MKSKGRGKKKEFKQLYPDKIYLDGEELKVGTLNGMKCVPPEWWQKPDGRWIHLVMVKEL